MNITREQYEADIRKAKAQALRVAADAALGPSPDLRDAATCRSIANYLRNRANGLDPS